jgi:hypothetical protein
MADFNSSLPVRTQTAGDVQSCLVDYTNPTTQGAKVDTHGSQYAVIANASGVATTSQANGAQQALDVGINVAGVQIDPRQIRALTAADVVTANQGTANTNANGWFVRVTDGTNNVAIKPASTAAAAADPSFVVALSPNSPLPAGTNAIGTVNASNFPTTVDTNYGTVGSSTLRAAAQIGNATGAADFNFGAASAQTLRVAALLGNASGLIDYNYGAIDGQAIRTASQIGNATGAANFGNGATGAQTLRVAANLAVAGADVTSLNPVPVTIVSTVLGTNVNKYNTTVNVAANGTTNHNYAVTASKTFTGKFFWASASGKIRADVQTSPDGTTFTTFWTGFNSTSDPNISINLDLLSITDTGTGATIRIVITNRDLAAFDVFSTISGVEN